MRVPFLSASCFATTSLICDRATTTAFVRGPEVMMRFGPGEELSPGVDAAIEEVVKCVIAEAMGR
jgi:hypothetical protein